MATLKGEADCERRTVPGAAGATISALEICRSEPDRVNRAKSEQRCAVETELPAAGCADSGSTARIRAAAPSVMAMTNFTQPSPLLFAGSSTDEPITDLTSLPDSTVRPGRLLRQSPYPVFAED